MSVERTEPRALKRQYPHVEEIEDWRAQQSIRLLWDRIFDLEARLQASEASLDTLVDNANDADKRIDSAKHDAREALALAQRPEDSTDIPGSGGAGIALPGGGDGGEGNNGCGDAGADGHVVVGVDFSAYNAGKIVCGTCAEFPALMLATAASETGDPADIEEREGNAEELMRRCIWHLKQAGFTAGRQQNPSGLLSRDKLTVEVDSGVADPPTYIRAYDIFIGKGEYWTDMESQMGETGPAVMVDDDGVAD